MVERKKLQLPLERREKPLRLLNPLERELPPLERPL